MQIVENIMIKQSRYKQILFSILSMTFFVAALYLIIGDFSSSGFVKRYESLILPVGICGVIFFGMTTLFLLYRLFVPKDILIIHKEGFVDCSTMASLGSIAWDDVKTIAPCVIGKQRLVGVDIKGVDRLLAKKTWYKRNLTRANMACGYSPITINLNSTKENVDDVILMMNYYLEEWRNTHEAIKDEKETFANSVLNQNILE